MNSLLWRKCLKYLQNMMPRQQFIEYISPIQINIKEKKLTILVPNDYIKEKITTYYLSIIKNILNNISNKNYNIKLQVGSLITQKFNIQTKNIYNNTIYNNINITKTLENFVEDNSNNFIKSTVIRIIKHLGHVYNPLFFYGSNGLGKTHLAHAIANEIKKIQKNTKIILLNAEKFIYDIEYFTNNQNIKELKKIYSSCHVLIIDDIHVMSENANAQEEFLKIINILIRKKKQIILTSNKPPETIKNLNQKIKEKLISNVIIKITLPNLKARIEILKNKLKKINISCHNNILEFIAKKSEKNIHELKNNLNYIITQLNSPKAITSLHEIKKLLEQNIKNISIKNIIDVTSKFYSTELDKIQQKTRHRSIVKTRQIIFYLCKKLTHCSLSEIGAALGKYNHTTVLYSYKKINNLIKENAPITHEINNIIKTLTK